MVRKAESESESEIYMHTIIYYMLIKLLNLVTVRSLDFLISQLNSSSRCYWPYHHQLVNRSLLHTRTHARDNSLIFWELLLLMKSKTDKLLRCAKSDSSEDLIRQEDGLGQYGGDGNYQLGNVIWWYYNLWEKFSCKCLHTLLLRNIMI